MSTSTEPQSADEMQAKQPIELEVQVESPQACLREVIVTIPQSEVQRYLKEAYDDLVPDAQVPGFRSGRAPRKLVEKQFKDRVTDQVKGSLLMDSLAQVTDTEEFSAIGEPDFDYNSITIPDTGDLGKKEDVLLAISTSGNSQNIYEALKVAKKMKIFSIGFFGNKGGKCKKITNIPIVVDSKITSHIQEAHITLGHFIFMNVEEKIIKK